MKAQIKIGNNIITGEGNNPQEVLDEIIALTEIFGQYKCGKCGSENLKYRKRVAKDKTGKKEYVYYELICVDCGAKLSFSQTDNGVLYPNRYLRDENGDFVLNEKGWKTIKGSDGWTKWDKELGKEV